MKRDGLRVRRWAGGRVAPLLGTTAGLLALSALAPPVLAQAAAEQSAETAFVVRRIRFEGLARVEEGTALNYLPVSPGDVLTPPRIAESLRALYRTGFFSDVAMYREGDTLLVRVKERPTIAQFSITGNKDIKTKDLTKGLNQVGLAEGRFFNRSVLDQVEQELRRQYFANGKYGVQITTEVEELPDNRVRIAVAIHEGEAAKIRMINIVGNSVFGDDELRRTLSLTTTRWYAFVARYLGMKDRYSRQALAGDLESLSSYYQDRGYIRFTIRSTQVSLSPDKRDIYIGIDVDEGQVYKVSTVDLAGELILPPDQLMAATQIKPGEVFSRKQVTASEDGIKNKLGDNGYAFANVETVPSIDEANKEVALTFVVRPGVRAYVRHVQFQGNSLTHDEALRRESRQLEGGVFNATQVQRTVTRLSRLPYVENVNVDTKPVPGNPDLVDVEFKITERSAGSFQVGAGYAGSEGLVLSTGISHANVFGTGNAMNLDLSASSYAQIYSLSVTEPYFTINGVSRTLGAFYRSTDRLLDVTSSFYSDSYGGLLRFGIPLSEYDTISLGGRIKDTKLRTDSEYSPEQVIEFVEDNGEHYLTTDLSAGYARDTRNRSLFPDKGYLHNVTLDVAVPAGDMQYYSIEYDFEQYFPISEELLFSINSGARGIDTYGDVHDVPPDEKFFGGGIRTVRGFRDGELGPRDRFDNPVGGDLLVYGQFELDFPTLLEGITNSRNMRLGVFVDTGNVYDDVNDFSGNGLRVSSGVGFKWLAPFVGMLELSVAAPIRDKKHDKTQIFNFSLGQRF